MSELFGRKLRVHISNLKTGEAVEYGDTFKIAFAFERNNSVQNPDMAEVNIYNAKTEFFSNVTNPNDCFLVIEGGYKDYVGRLFAGMVSEIKVGRQGLDVVVTITCGDGLAGLKSNTQSTYKKKTAYSKIVEDMLNDLKTAGIEIAKGVPSMVKNLLTGKKTDSSFTFSGSTAKALDELLNPEGLEAVISNNELNIREMIKPINRPAIVLAWDTGLVSVKRTLTELKKKQDKKVIKTYKVGVEFECFIVPNIVPAQQIKVESEFIEGFYTVYSVAGSGSNRDGSFTMTGVAHE